MYENGELGYLYVKNKKLDPCTMWKNEFIYISDQNTRKS